MRFILFFIALTLVNCSSISVKNSSKYQVDDKNIHEVLTFLTSDELKGREMGTQENQNAAAYLANKLEEYKIKPLFTTYNDTLYRVRNTWNIVGVIPGNDKELKNEYVVLGAHYDHIGIQPSINGDSIANGANDDASGVTILAEIARNLAKQKHKRSIVIAFFTGEEKGLLGSKHLARKLKNQGANVVMMLNFEMLGVPMKRDYMAYFTGFNKSNLAAKINEFAGEKFIGILDKEEKYQLFKRSDNYPFYLEFKIPSHTFSSFDFENFEYYHHVKDELDQLDLKFIEDFTQKAIPIVDEIINLPKGEIN